MGGWRMSWELQAHGMLHNSSEPQADGVRGAGGEAGGGGQMP